MTWICLLLKHQFSFNKCSLFTLLRELKNSPMWGTRRIHVVNESNG